MNSSTKKILKFIFISMIFYMLICSYLINKMSWPYFEEFLKQEKHLHYDNKGHKFGWFGPNGPLIFKSSGTTDVLIYRQYDVTFLDEKGNKIEYSAFEMFGIFFDTSKN